MQAVFNKQLKDLTSEVGIALNVVKGISPSLELIPFKKWLENFYEQTLANSNKLQGHLDLGISLIYPDIYSSMAVLQRNFRVINAKFLPALYRHQAQDKIVLNLLMWLHEQHMQTRNKPFAVQDADFAILPTIDYPLIYFLPITSQHTLLHLPLFFHELGHFLYVYHQDRMVEITQNLQRRLEDYLVIPVQQNDERSKAEKKRNDLIVETWFDWLNELFCDAVGLCIGGPAYLHSFSAYLLSTGSSAFFYPEKDLPRSKHPVTWIRIKVLIHLARKLGLSSEAQMLEEEWGGVATTVKVKENYFGYFNEVYMDDVVQALELMLSEATPIRFTDYQYNSKTLDPSNYVQLVNVAWNKYVTEPNDYFTWEESIIRGVKIDLDTNQPILLS